MDLKQFEHNFDFMYLLIIWESKSGIPVSFIIIEIEIVA